MTRNARPSAHLPPALLLRPNGQIERLSAAPLPGVAGGYASERAGRIDAAAAVLAARADRRRHRRLALDLLAGRLVDLEV